MTRNHEERPRPITEPKEDRQARETRERVDAERRTRDRESEGRQVKERRDDREKQR
jgi:hypothetical protein